MNFLSSQKGVQQFNVLISVASELWIMIFMASFLADFLALSPVFIVIALRISIWNGIIIAKVKLVNLIQAELFVPCCWFFESIPIFHFAFHVPALILQLPTNYNYVEIGNNVSAISRTISHFSLCFPSIPVYR